MNVFGNSSKQLLQALTANAEKETMDYVLQEMQAVLGLSLIHISEPTRP